MSKLSFRARALDASKPMPIYLAEELPDLPDYSAINRAVPQMPSGMEKEEESEHHLQRAISGTGLIIPTPEVCEVTDLVFYERCYPPDYKMPKQHIHMQPLWEEQEAPEYDMDSEDEKWLKQQRHPDLTELVFEQMMDKLEKCSGQTVVTLSEAKLLLAGRDDLIIAVYDYWLTKRLNTQHPLILSVRTESRPGQPANNPYLAFRRRTEKMQTRKNRKNDESSYEKMLKLRRDLARALSLLQLVAKRERAKRDMVRLTHAVAHARYRAQDFQDPPSVAHDTQPRVVYTAVTAGAGGASALRREALAVQYTHTPDRQPRQREKRPYKRKKHRHHTLGAIPPPHRAECLSGASSSSDEAGADAASPDPGPFAFRRKPGCYYEMPTSTLCGEPLPADRATDNVLYEHEIDERHRYTLTSLSVPVGVCIGFARRRVGRGGRILLDRRATPLDDLWPTLPHTSLHPHSSEAHRQLREEVELETKAHRRAKEMSRDFQSAGRYPWRRAFRTHLARNPGLWVEDVKPEVKAEDEDIKMEVDLPQDSDISLRTTQVKCEPSDVDSAVRDNLQSVIRKRRWSPCSDDSECDSESELYPVEKEFEKFFSEVTRKWLNFRPKTPPPSPPEADEPDLEPLGRDEPFAVELRELGAPLADTSPYTTRDLSLGALFEDLAPLVDDTGMSVDGTEDWGQGDKVAPADVDTDAFLSQGQGLSGRASPGRGPRGSSRVSVRARPAPAVPRPRPLQEPPPQVEQPPTPVKKTQKSPVKDQAKLEKEKLERERVEKEKERERRVDWPPPSPVPNSNIIVEEVNEVPQQIKVEKKKGTDTIEEVVLAHGVQLKTVQTKHSPLKKHIITSGASRRPDTTQVVATSSTAAQQDAAPPQLLTVAVSDNLKVRIQNHIVSDRVVGLMGNGPFASVVSAPSALPSVPLSLHHTTHTVASVAHVAGTVGTVRRTVSAHQHRTPLVQLAGATSTHAPRVLAPSHTIHHVAPNKLKVLHAHPLTHTQRNQLLAGNRSITQLPAVVSLATLGEAKTSNTALLKAAPGQVTQFIEIKGTQFGKGPHLVNVVRGAGAAGKAGVARLDLNDPKKRQVVATIDPAQLKGNIQAVSRPHRVSVSMEGAQPVAVRAHQLRHQIQLKGRALLPPLGAAGPRAGGGVGGGQPATIPGSVVANLLHKNVLPKGGQKIAISSAVSMSGVSVGGSVQAIAFTTAQLKARQARLIAQRHLPQPHSEIVEAVATTSGSGGGGAGAGGDDAANGAVRRPNDTLPMEVT